MTTSVEKPVSTGVSRRQFTDQPMIQIQAKIHLPQNRQAETKGLFEQNANQNWRHAKTLQLS